jgi:hypothetical protein
LVKVVVLVNAVAPAAASPSGPTAAATYNIRRFVVLVIRIGFSFLVRRPIQVFIAVHSRRGYRFKYRHSFGAHKRIPLHGIPGSTSSFSEDRPSGDFDASVPSVRLLPVSDGRPPDRCSPQPDVPIR